MEKKEPIVDLSKGKAYISTPTSNN